MHLENGHRVYFTEENAEEVAETPPETKVTAFFKLNNEDPFARSLLYNEIPAYYTWDTQSKMFKRRRLGAVVEGEDGVRRADALGRVYTVHLRHAECYLLRLLLHTVRSARSFCDLRVVDAYECETYRQACQLLGLLQSDNQWRWSLEEACQSRMPGSIRHLFAMLLSYCEVSNPLALWEAFKETMAEYYLHLASQHVGNDELGFSAREFDLCLRAIPAPAGHVRAITSTGGFARANRGHCSA